MYIEDTSDDLNPAKLDVPGWEKLLQKMRDDRDIARNLYEFAERSRDKEGKFAYQIPKNRIRKYTKNVDEVLRKGIVSQEVSTYWKRHAADKIVKYYNLPDIQFQPNKHSIKGKWEWMDQLKELSRRMKRFAGENFVLHREDMLLLARVSGMPEATEKAYKAKLESDTEMYGTYKKEFEELQENVERYKAVIKKRKALDTRAEHQKRIEQAEARGAAKIAKAAEKRRKAAKRRKDKTITVTSKQLGKRERGRSATPERGGSRARTLSPPKVRSKSKRDTSIDRSEGAKRGRTSRAKLMAESEVAHRGRATGKRGSEAKRSRSASRQRTSGAKLMAESKHAHTGRETGKRTKRGQFEDDPSRPAARQKPNRKPGLSATAGPYVARRKPHEIPDESDL